MEPVAIRIRRQVDERPKKKLQFVVLTSAAGTFLSTDRAGQVPISHSMI